MNTLSNTLFLVAFLGQIFLTSYVMPSLLLRRMGRVLEEYPPSRYPKLYPRPIEHYRLGHAVFRWANWALVLVGFGVLYAAFYLDGGTFANDGYISEMWPTAYGMLQFLPLVALEIAGFGQFRMMREANTQTKRSAELRPRRLLESMSIPLLALALLSLAAFVCVLLYLNDFNLAWGSDALENLSTVLGGNLFMLLVGLWQTYGRKLDPHQSAADRQRMVRMQWGSLLLVSTVLSLFLLVRALGDKFDQHFLDPALMSLYFQLIVVASIGFLLSQTRIEDIDFEVYASDQPSQDGEHKHAI